MAMKKSSAFPLRGWKAQVVAGIIVALLTLVANLSFLVWAVASSSDRLLEAENLIEVFHGDCNKSNNIYIGVTLVLNLLSTLLLGTSSACARILMSPSSNELRAAHDRETCLQIGIFGADNFRFISRRRAVAFLCLAIASIPIHLFYNSIIFQVQSTNDFLVLLTASNFPDGGPWNHTHGVYNRGGCYDDVRYLESDLITTPAKIESLQAAAGKSLIRMENRQCLETFFKAFVTDYVSVVLVSESNNDTSTVLDAFVHRSRTGTADLNIFCGTPYSLAGRSFSCDIKGQLAMPDDWRMPRQCLSPAGPVSTWPEHGCPVNETSGVEISSEYADFFCSPFPDEYHVQVDHCLAEPIEPGCALGLSRNLTVAVLICNSIILGILSASLVMCGPLRMLLAPGDVLCLASERAGSGTYADHKLSSSTTCRHTTNPDQKLSSHTTQQPDLTHSRSKSIWGQSITGIRWYLSLALFIGAVVTALALFLAPRQVHGYITTAKIRSLGLGTIDTDFLVHPSHDLSVTANLIVSELPQLLISLLYLLYSNIFTSFFRTLEMQRYEHGRADASVRVSSKGHGTNEPSEDPERRSSSMQKQDSKHPHMTVQSRPTARPDTQSIKYFHSSSYLQIPYRYDIILTAAFILLHWLISQSLFPALIQVRDSTRGWLPQRSIVATGWSPLAIILSLSLGTAIILALVLFGCWRIVVDSNQTGVSVRGQVTACSVRLYKMGARLRASDDAGSVHGGEGGCEVPLSLLGQLLPVLAAVQHDRACQQDLHAKVVDEE